MAIEFRYYAGIEWLTSWDTEGRGCLPLAVEIALMMASPEQDPATRTPLAQPPALLATTGSAMTGSATTADEASHYRLVVQLPVARVAAEAATTTTGGLCCLRHPHWPSRLVASSYWLYWA